MSTLTFKYEINVLINICKRFKLIPLCNNNDEMQAQRVKSKNTLNNKDYPKIIISIFYKPNDQSICPSFNAVAYK